MVSRGSPTPCILISTRAFKKCLNNSMARVVACTIGNDTEKSGESELNRKEHLPLEEEEISREGRNND